MRHGVLDQRSRSPSGSRGAVRCVDPFPCGAGSATDALDEVRREVWNEARKAGEVAAAKDLKGALLRAVEEPREPDRPPEAELSSVQKTNKRLFRAYLLKEKLRPIYRCPPTHALGLLDAGLEWARRCASTVRQARETITEQRAGIEAAIEHGLSNARVEAINTQIRMITRRAFGFHAPAR